jgi:hypothetical protein
MSKLPSDVLKFFQKQGKRGGKVAAESMTPEQRKARAKKAAAASASVRSAKSAARRKKAGVKAAAPTARL